MAGISTSDKSLFQARRVVVPISDDKPPEKKKFRPGKFLPFKKLFGKNNFLKKIFFANKKRGVISVAVFLIVIGGGGFEYYEYLLSQNPAVIYARKVTSMTNTIDQQVSLPTNEQPVIATVTNVKVLPKEPFFQDAQNGDKILMYKKDKKAILYRPSTATVITVASLDFQDVKPTSGPAVAGASTSAVLKATIIGITPPVPVSPTPTVPYVPQGKILVQPPQ